MGGGGGGGGGGGARKGGSLFFKTLRILVSARVNITWDSYITFEQLVGNRGGGRYTY